MHYIFLLGFLGTSLLVSLATPIAAQESVKASNIAGDIKARQARQDALTRQADQLKSERAELRRAIITLAQELQSIDTSRDKLEARLDELALVENQLQTQLLADRRALAHVLAGLQNLQATRPPDFIVHADDALNAVRSALLMGRIAPHMRGRANALEARLRELAAIHRRIERQTAALESAERKAQKARDTLSIALAEKARTEAEARTAARLETQALARLVREARNLQDLARQLIARKKARDIQRAKKRESKKPNSVTSPSDSAFARARGQIALPVIGQITSRFKDNASPPVQLGLTIAARQGASITAPYDARILYVGAFRQYGHIVILSIDRHYQMILAGLGTIFGYVGQDILAGEPLGTMPALSVPAPLPKQEKLRRQPLYMELRYKGEPIDPAPFIKTGF